MFDAGNRRNYDDYYNILCTTDKAFLFGNVNWIHFSDPRRERPYKRMMFEYRANVRIIEMIEKEALEGVFCNDLKAL